MRAFFGRFVIAVIVGSVLMAGAVAGVDHEVARKLGRIPKIDLVTAPLPPDGANYLVIGSDSREDLVGEFARGAFGDPATEGGRRSDTIMVVHVEPRAERTLVVSFPRDLLVNIPGRGPGKINAAYNDGPQTLINTITTNFGIEINHYIELNFESFVGLVDQLGSVTVYLSHPARDPELQFEFPTAGCVALDGERALQWVRSRTLELRNPRTGLWVPVDQFSPDIRRIERQQDFMRRLAGLAVAKSLSNPLTANSVADEVVRNLKADDAFDQSAVFDLIKSFRTLNPDDTSALVFRTMPWRDGGIVNGQSVLRAEMGLAAPLIEELRTFDTRPKPTPAPSSIRVRVVNSSGRAELGVAVQQGLAELGFVTTDVVERSGKRARGTTVRHAGGQLEKAKLLLRYLEPEAALASDEASLSGADVEIVLGRQFAQLVVPADWVDPATTSTAPPAPIDVVDPPLAPSTPAPTTEVPDPAPRDTC
jgi:LCP family protein required for cell wall assembly